DRAVDRVRVQVGGCDPVTAGLLGEPVDRVDPDLGDRVGVRFGDGFDFDTAFGGQHAEVLLFGAIEGETRVVLLGDVGRDFDPEGFHDVAADVEAEDVAGVFSHLLCVVGELHPTGLPASADLHLCFAAVWGSVPGRVREGFVVGGVCVTGSGGDVVPRDVVVVLIFAKVRADCGFADGRRPNRLNRLRLGQSGPS